MDVKYKQLIKGLFPNRNLLLKVLIALKEAKAAKDTNRSAGTGARAPGGEVAIPKIRKKNLELKTYSYNTFSCTNIKIIFIYRYSTVYKL